jgi:hypothetical protein
MEAVAVGMTSKGDNRPLKTSRRTSRKITQ